MKNNAKYFFNIIINLFSIETTIIKQFRNIVIVIKNRRLQKFFFENFNFNRISLRFDNFLIYFIGLAFPTSFNNSNIIIIYFYEYLFYCFYIIFTFSFLFYNL